MRAEELRVEFDALRGEEGADEILRFAERGFRERVRAEPVLVAHEHEAVAGTLEFEQRRNHARQQADLREAVDLFVDRLLHQRAVAIDEQDACSTHGCSTAASSRWFWSGVPIEMRRQFASPG